MKKLAAASIAAAVAAILVYAAVSQDGGERADRGLGMVINAPGAADAEQARLVYAQAASAGIGRTNAYMFWNLVEPEPGRFDWRSTDPAVSLSAENELSVTLFFSLVNGSSLGPFPEWMGEPGLDSVDEDALVAVLDAALSRYDSVDSLIIAGQAEERFRYSEPDERAYADLFGRVYPQLKERHPGVLVGSAYSLHGLINKGLERVVDGDAGDFVAFTYFPVDSLNEISRTPSEARADLELALELAAGRPAAFFEVGWSTSEFVGGSEADQAEFAAEMLDFYAQNRNSIEFATWYRQYDRPAGSCSVVANLAEGRVSVGGSAGLGSSEHVAERLGHYVCASGLLREDGSPKPAWAEFARP